MGEWFIAELVDGQIKGSGYGGILTKEDIPEKLGHLVVMKNRKEKENLGKKILSIDYKICFFLDDDGESLFEEGNVCFFQKNT